MQSITGNEIKFIFTDFLGDFFYFFIWWYTAGLKRTVIFCVDSVKGVVEEWSLMIWIKNIFVPMYGRYDWQNRAISFVMRLLNIIFRFLVVVLWAVIVFVFFVFWLILPIFIISQIIYHYTMIIR